MAIAPAVLTLVLAGYLAVSGIAKLVHPVRFADVLVQTYRIAPRPASLLAGLSRSVNSEPVSSPDYRSQGRSASSPPSDSGSLS